MALRAACSGIHIKYKLTNKQTISHLQMPRNFKTLYKQPTLPHPTIESPPIAPTTHNPPTSNCNTPPTPTTHNPHSSTARHYRSAAKMPRVANKTMSDRVRSEVRSEVANLW